MTRPAWPFPGPAQPSEAPQTPARKTPATKPAPAGWRKRKPDWGRRTTTTGAKK